MRAENGLVTAYKRIDTCAAEFESFTPYLYGTYEKECEADPTTRRKVVILGSGPNRIGQGLEFDYCCCHAAFALRDEGYETVMINCNPETVSTDYDTVDRLYFEPLTFEDVSAIIAREEQGGGEVSCVVQYGGQTPLKLSLRLQAAGIRIIGTSPDSIDLAEDRERFAQLLWDLGIPQAPSGTATSVPEAREVAAKIGFPLVVRPSYVLGGRGMAIVYDTSALDRYMTGRSRGVARATPSSSTSSSRTRSSSTSTPSPIRRGRSSSAGSWSTSRRRGFTPATARASCRRTWSRRATSRRFATTRGASRVP